MNGHKTTFKQELAIIPTPARVLGMLAWVGLLIVMMVVSHHPQAGHGAPPPPAAMAFIGLVGGFIAMCWVLLLGYVNADAARRGMGRWLWTLVCLLVPNALGFLAYFLVRKPLTGNCPQCGQPISSDFRFCPKCNYQLMPSCPHCGRAIGRDYVFCPYCGQSVSGVAPATPGMAQG